MRLAVLLAILPAPLLAHPHVFVDATVEVLTDAGAVTGVRIAWTYDDLFSLMLTEDLGIDGDGDGDLVLTDAETEALRASVADWPSDYEGDLMVEAGDDPLLLSSREDHGVIFDGAVLETHRRPLVQPAPATAGAIVVKVSTPTTT